MEKIYFALGIHNHQPVGNFDFVFEEAYQKAYLPFLETLEKHPHIKVGKHFSGILYDWILEHHPDFMARLKVLVDSGQVELMTGGYYEPILAIIPDQDKIGQIHKLTNFVRAQFDFDPTGLWLAERIWEPHLCKYLCQAGVDHTFVDDSHFKYAGLKEEDLLGYFITEEDGHTVNVFPISEKLRYTMPFEEPQVTIEFLHSLAKEEGKPLVVFADDGEKFGVWPGTYDHVFKKGWLDSFFTLLEENRDWIELLHFKEALQTIKPLGRIYLPTASYREMMHWALFPKTFREYEDFEQRLQDSHLLEKYRTYVRGGFWRNFLAKYPEANNLHKKMLLVSRRVWNTWAKHGDNERVRQARDELWAGQCNCAYWHGVFGGLYLNHLRYAVYHHLIRAEAILDELDHGVNAAEGWIRSQILDFNSDGREEILISTKSLNLYVSPDQGGKLLEIDYKPKAINLLDTMTRREEGYHRKLKLVGTSSQGDKQVASIHDLISTKEEGLEKLLFYDRYQRCSLIDHFLNEATILENFANCEYGEEGDFIDQPYSFQMKKGEGFFELKLDRNGTICSAGQMVPLSVSKKLRVNAKKTQLIIDYSLQNLENAEVDLWFGIEFNFALLAGDSPDRHYFFPGLQLEDERLKSIGEVEDVKRLGLRDEWLGLEIELEFSKKARIWRFPVETVSLSEAGFERVYQNSVVLPSWKLHLMPEEQWTTRIVKTIRDL